MAKGPIQYLRKTLVACVFIGFDVGSARMFKTPVCD